MHDPTERLHRAGGQPMGPSVTRGEAAVRVLKTLFWLVVAVILVTLGLANRAMVELKALPEPLDARLGPVPDLELPLFLVILGGVALGMLIGFIWEWLREVPERAQARALARELEALRAEVARRQAEAGRADVLAGIGLPAVERR